MFRIDAHGAFQHGDEEELGPFALKGRAAEIFQQGLKRSGRLGAPVKCDRTVHRSRQLDVKIELGRHETRPHDRNIADGLVKQRAASA